MTDTRRDYSAERGAFLASLDWTGPYADLYDAVVEFLLEAEVDKRRDPVYADAFNEHFRTGEYGDVFLTSEDVAELADSIVSKRLR